MKATKVFDAGEKWIDRYTVFFDTGDVYTMSENADMPNGFCMYNGNIEEDNILTKCCLRINLYSPINIEDLPKGTKRKIKYLEGVYG